MQLYEMAGAALSKIKSHCMDTPGLERQEHLGAGQYSKTGAFYYPLVCMVESRQSPR